MKIIHRNNFLLFLFLLSTTLSAHQIENNITILFTGQSNAQRLDSDDISFFNDKYNEYTNGNGTSISSVSAYGGSAVLAENSSASNLDNYWVNRSINSSIFSDGPRLLQTINFINSMPSTPSIIIWMQGEQDATRATNISDKNNYKLGLSYIFDRLKSEITDKNVTFGISVTGRRINSNKEKGIQLIRQAQHELSTLRGDTTILSETYDLELEDHVHYSYNGQRKLLNRIAKSLSSHTSGNGFNQAPKIKTINLNANDKTKLLVELDNTKKIYKGSRSSWLLSAHYGNRRVNVTKTYGVSNSLILVTLESPITTRFTFHVGNGKYNLPEDISTSGRFQIRNEHLLPLSSGIYPIEGGRW